MKKLFGILALLFMIGILFSSCTKKEIVPAQDWGFEHMDLRGDEVGDLDCDGDDPDGSIDNGEDPDGDDDGITDDDDDEDEDDGGAARNAEGG
jgi:hypothetical protein